MPRPLKNRTTDAENLENARLKANSERARRKPRNKAMTQEDANQQDQTTDNLEAKAIEFGNMSDEDKVEFSQEIEEVIASLKAISEEPDEPGFCYACHRAELEKIAMPALAGYVMTFPNQAEELAKAMRLAINTFTGVTEVAVDE